MKVKVNTITVAVGILCALSIIMYLLPQPTATVHRCPVDGSEVRRGMWTTPYQNARSVQLSHATEHPKQYYPSHTDLIKHLHHGKNPYADLPADDRADLERYRSYAQIAAPAIHAMVRKHLRSAPRFIVEVGSFIGSGVVYAWAPLVKGHGGAILSVDSWLGDVNMRLIKEFDYMELEHGVPIISRRFLQRMAREGLNNTVIPLALPSLVGLRALSIFNWIIDIIYVDAAHEQGETYAELTIAYQLLRAGGLIMGDDYDDAFPAVVHDVDMFAADHNATIITFARNQWLVQKQ